MKRYEYGRIATLAAKLREAEVAPATIRRIMQGGRAIRRNTTPDRKARWMLGAMRRMDQLLDAETRQAVRERCACCLGGRRLKMAQAIQRRSVAQEDGIRAANEAKLVFGHSVSRQADGRLLVRFAPEGLPSYRCVCLPQAQEPFPMTYCYCCGGHVKHHLQVALGRKLVCEVRSSALASGGKQPCSFLLAVADGPAS